MDLGEVGCYFLGGEDVIAVLTVGEVVAGEVGTRLINTDQNLGKGVRTLR